MARETTEAAVKLGSAIVQIACKLCLGPLEGVGTAFSEILASRIQDGLQRRRVERVLDECIDVVADQSLRVLSSEFKDLPSNEAAAAMLSLGDVFTSTRLDSESLVRNDLDATRVRQLLAPAAARVSREAGLSESGQALFDRMLHESAAYLVEVATTLPDFPNQSFRELLRRGTQTQEDLQRVLSRLPRSRADGDFTTDYLRWVVNKLDRMELFGVTLHEASRRYPLSVAYMSLNVVSTTATKGKARPSTTGSASTSMRVEDALSGSRRVLLIGDAGSGKTTVLRWLAVGSARSALPPALSDFNQCVPFLLPLRLFAESELPAPEAFLQKMNRSLHGEMPQQWVHSLLRNGRALLLVDGLDELPEGPPRDRAFEWLLELMDTFPNARYIVTSRPAAAKEHRFGADFLVAEFQPMTPSDIHQFVERWHRAVARELLDQHDVERLEGDQRAFLAAIEGDRHLRALTVNPLLCAMLCALNRERQRALPKERMEVYSAALDMLLVRRDRERGIEGDINLSGNSQVLLLQELAFWLMRQGLSDVPLERARHVVRKVAQSLPDETRDPDGCIRYLVARSGLLREPVEGRLNFVHRTFQEYLAGKAAVEGDELELLVEKAADDQWREVIIMAVGHAHPKQREQLLRELVTRATRAGAVDAKLALLAVACLQTSPQLEPSVREAVEDLARALVPPSTMEAAESLIGVGDLVIDVLETRKPTSGPQARASVRLLASLGGGDALRLIGDIGAEQSGAEDELVRAWRLFDRQEFAERVISRATSLVDITIRDHDLLPFTGYFVQARTVRLDLPQVPSLEGLGQMPPHLRSLHVTRKPRLTIRGLERWSGLRDLTVVSTNTTVDLTPVAAIVDLEIVSLNVVKGIAVAFRLAPLQALGNLREVHLNSDGRASVDLSELQRAKALSVYVPSSFELLNRDKLGPGCQVIIR